MVTERMRKERSPYYKQAAPGSEKPFNDWGGRGCHKFVPVLGGDGTKIAPPGDLFDQPPGEMSSIRGKLADNVEDHLVLSPEGVVLVTSPGTDSSYPPPPPVVETTRVGNPNLTVSRDQILTRREGKLIYPVVVQLTTNRIGS